MLTETVRISFYRTKRCGYYEHRTHCFGDLGDTFRQLHRWSQGLALSLTKISDPPPESDLLPTYLMDIQQVGDEWMFALWIQTPDHEGTVASISMNSVVGQPRVHENALEPLTLAGFPAYFWCSPQKGLFATIGFQGQKAGRLEMEKYFSDFLACLTSHVVVEKEPGGVERVVGYRNAQTDEVAAVRPLFSIAPITNPGEIEVIKKRQAEIKKVIRKAHLRTDKVIDKDFFGSLVRFLGGSTTNNVETASKTVLVELEYTPGADELATMIETELSASHSGWDDMGFVLRGEAASPYWLGRSRASDTFEFEVKRVERVPTLTSVAEAFSKARDEILALVKS